MRNLLLIPTEPELRFLRPRLNGFATAGEDCGNWSIALCGFGLIAAAARSAMLIAQQRPQRVVLVGIAGSLVDSLAVGSAWTFDRVLCHGIGVGGDADYLSAAQMGWSHWPGSGSSPAIGEAIELGGGKTMKTRSQNQASCADLPAAAVTLLSVCAASANRAQAQQRQRAYPDAIAEDMEGFGVAMACALAGVPLQIVRGISNRAGERDLSRWQIEPALAAAAERVKPILEQAIEEPTREC